jgi:hypothetical protein
VSKPSKRVEELEVGDRVRLADGQVANVTAVAGIKSDGLRYFWTDLPHWIGGDSIHCYNADRTLEIVEGS